MWMAPTTPPANSAAAVPHVRKFMLKLFKVKDGQSQDWPVIAETLLVVAFDIIDQVPDDPVALALLQRVNSGSFRRLGHSIGAGWTESRPQK